MRRFVPHGRRVLLTGAAIAVLAAVAGGIAYSAIPSGGVIQGCYSNRNGTLHVIDVAAGDRCARSETALAWNQTGPVGPQGAAGAVGPRGPAGAAGPQGLQGLIGPTGPRGLTGPAGLAGAAGLQGIPGLIGPPGLQGPIGLRGSPGAPGPQGATGATGAAGPAGLPGLTGATGPNGSQGIPGLIGPPGETGSIGPQGLPGIDGATGTPGPQGPPGDVGPAGPTGDTGPAGPPAPAGSGSGSGSDAFAARDPGPTTVTDTPNDVVTTSSLPAGHYILNAKASFRNTPAGSSTTLTCVLHGDGVTIDSATVDSVDGGQTVTLLGVATFSDAATVGLRCSTSTGSVLVSDMQLVVLSVSSITINDPGVGF